MKICPICGNDDFTHSVCPVTSENLIFCTICGEDFLDSDDYEEDEIGHES